MFNSWKATLKQAIPPALLNALLLRFPSLYHTKLVFYETNLRPLGGIDELLAQLARGLDVDGQIIECGSSRCGASVIMAQYLRSQQVNKKILACDTPSRHIVGERHSVPVATRGVTAGQTTTLRCDTESPLALAIGQVFTKRQSTTGEANGRHCSCRL